MNKTQVKIFRSDSEVIELPEHKTESSAGADVCAYIAAPISIGPNKSAMINTGIYTEIPEGWEIQVRPRSGLAAKHQVTVLNSPGTIDGDYRGEIKVILINHGKSSFRVNSGDRIGQLVLNQVAQFDWKEVESVEHLSETLRGEGGFGHTGK